MKVYYEYEYGTFWAIRAEGGCCYTCEGSKYVDFWPELMPEAGDEEKNRFMAPNAKKTTF